MVGLSSIITVSFWAFIFKHKKTFIFSIIVLKIPKVDNKKPFFQPIVGRVAIIKINIIGVLLLDYKKLAELLFPQIDKTPDYYEEQYPERGLPEGARVTRFAPSPTNMVS